MSKRGILGTERSVNASCRPEPAIRFPVRYRTQGDILSRSTARHCHARGIADQKAWTAALERAGIEDFRWHDLRHTFATWHRQAGTPTHELQRLGGWKTGAMVERYAHVAPEALQGAAIRFDAFGGYVAGTPERPTAEELT